MTTPTFHKESPLNKSAVLFVLILNLVLAGLCARAEIAVLESSSADDVTSSDDYIEPFLITRSSKKLTLSATSAKSIVKSKLRLGALDIRGSFSSAGETVEQFKPEKYSLPPGFFEETQVEALKSCTKEKCLMKLNAQEEIPLIAKAKNKQELYQQFVFERIKKFLLSKQLLGYEDRKSNQSAVKKMLSLVNSLSKSPKTQLFLRENLWSGTKGGGEPQESWIRQEIVNIAPDQMQPILRVSENFEFQEGDRTIFVELHIYTNHYFDSSLIIYEIVPSLNNKGGIEVIVTDVMEIDELKKTALIRAMFKGKMVKAVTTYQSQFLNSLAKASQK